MSRLARLLTGAALLLAALAGSSSSASAATCADYGNQAAAQQAADTRDADGDGLYCEALPCPCSTGAGGGSDGAGGTGDDSAERRRQAAARKQAAERQRRAVARRRAAARRRALARKRAAEHRERVARQRVERGQWRVSRVADGDTIKVRRTDGSTSETVQLLGVDAPEAPDECGASQATALLLALTFSAPADADGDGVLETAGGRGALVDLETDRSQAVRDESGRLLAYVDVTGDIPPFGDPAGYDLGQKLVVAGLSPVSARNEDQDFARQGRYEQAEARAIAERAGSWSACEGDFHSSGG
jgi:endonuclease YncB( thermonuclease family)